MEERATEALEKIAGRVLEIFKKDFVRKLVYQSHGTNKVYKPTYEFEKAWQWTPLKKQVMTLSKEMYYNPIGMTLDRDNFIHGSNFPKSSPSDARKNLADILNKSGKSSSLWVSVSRPVPYWDVFILAAFQGGMLSKIVNEEFTKVGFKRV
jgi:uncharacterized phage-associated protein